MEKEISFLEFFLMIARFVKRHFKKYVITTLLFVVISIGIYLFQKPVQRTTLYLSSDYFARKEIFSFVNLMNTVIVSHDSTEIKTQFGVNNASLFDEVNKISCDTMQPVFTNIYVDMEDTAGEKKIMDGIMFFIKHNIYTITKIDGLLGKNKFLLKKLNQLEKNLLADSHENVVDKSNIINDNILNAGFYEQIANAKKVIDEYDSDKIITFYNDFSHSRQVLKFWKIDIILFLIFFSVATFFFFILDINRLLK